MAVLTDKRFHAFLGDFLKLVGFYGPLVFIVAPVNNFLLGVLITAAIVALLLKFSIRFPLWISALVSLALAFSIQIRQINDPLFSTYFVECNSFNKTCFSQHETEILGQDIRVWPYHSNLPIVGAYKSFWTKAAAGQAQFQGHQLQHTEHDGQSVTNSPLETLLFNYLGGDDDLEGADVLYRTLHSHVIPELDLSIVHSPFGNGELSFGFGSTFSTAKPKTHLVSQRSSRRDFSFFAQGDPIDVATWYRAIRNDIWLSQMPLIDGNNLVQKIEKSDMLQSRRERLLFGAFELYSWCRRAENSFEELGCRARLDAMQSALEKAVADGATVAPLTRHFLTETHEFVDLSERFGGSSLVTTWFDSENVILGAQLLLERKGLQPYSESESSDGTSVTAPEKISNLETTLQAQFPVKIVRTAEEFNACETGALKALKAALKNEVFSEIVKARRDYHSCFSDDNSSTIDKTINEPVDVFRESLRSLKQNSDTYNFRQYTVALMAAIDSKLDEHHSGKFTSLLNFFQTFVLSGDPNLLYSKAVKNELNAWSETSRIMDDLFDKRQSLLGELNDANPRVQKYFSGNIELLSQKYFGQSVENILMQRILKASELLLSTYPEPSEDPGKNNTRFLKFALFADDTGTDPALLDEILNSAEFDFLKGIDIRPIEACVQALAGLFSEESTTTSSQDRSESDAQDSTKAKETSLTSDCPVSSFLNTMQGAGGIDWEDSLKLGKLHELLEASLPNAANFVLPDLETVKPRTVRTDFQDAYQQKFFEFMGKSALGLTVIDWKNLPSTGDRAHGYPFTNENVQDDDIVEAEEFVCKSWGETLHLRSSLLGNDKLWKQTGLLIPISHLEALCEEDAKGFAQAALLETFGSDVLEALADTVISSSRRATIQSASLDELENLVIGTTGTFADRMAIARLALFSVDRSATTNNDKFEQTETPIISNPYLVLLSPWQSTDPLNVSVSYQLGMNQLLASSSQERRAATLALVKEAEPDFDQILDQFIGPERNIDKTEVSQVLSLVRVLREIDSTFANDLALMIEPDHLSPSGLELTVDLFLENDARLLASERILMMPNEEITPSKRRAWTKEFVDEDNRIRANSFAALSSINAALNHMYDPQ